MRGLVLAASLLLCLGTPQAWAQKLVGGYPEEEALRLGERMYREGILPSGEPMEALVQGDIPVLGTMFSCQSCHLRSGLGSVEGSVVTPPVNATELFQDYTRAPSETIPPWQDIPESFRPPLLRPAYTDDTLAKVIWTGVDSSGRQLAPTMPLYLLEDEDMEILVYYLRHLSAEPSPGVTDESLTFATVIAGPVDPAAADAMVKTLQAYVRDRNLPNRRPTERARKGVFYRRHMTQAWRRLELLVWRLDGDPGSWPRQLERLYRKQPVFALIGGMAQGDWAPIQRFCEQHRLPAVFPMTEWPALEEENWYTIYFDRGLAQETDALARYLARLEGPEPVLVVGEDAMATRARDLYLETWRRIAGQVPEAIPVADWQKHAANWAGRPVVLLAGDEIRPALLRQADSRSKASFYLLHRLAPDLAESPPENLRGRLRVTWPWRLPEQQARYRRLVAIWLKGRGIEMTHPAVQSRGYFIGWMLSGVLMHMQSDFYRDYLLDIIDMMNDETYAIADYPRLSFGPGQRFASKGCYVVGFDPQGRMQALSDWVVH
ncbi:MAG: ABC transporter substrate-binding protein [Geothermobacteraceae bacterium]